jgi:putative Mg2+ transporter-C (MgtC) family protein
VTGQELELVLRLVGAAVVGALVGVEREVHGHPAGMRTHLLVALGSAIFTVLSFHGFAGLGGEADPTRIAAQIVSGIGFLGAGAILKEGFTIRGLTTAASLWSTAALGMAAGVGELVITAAGTVIVLVSLWPLRPVADRLEGTRLSRAHMRVEVETFDAVAHVRETLQASGLDVAGSRSRRLPTGRYELELDVRRRAGGDVLIALTALEPSSGVTITAVDQVE